MSRHSSKSRSLTVNIVIIIVLFLLSFLSRLFSFHLLNVLGSIIGLIHLQILNGPHGQSPASSIPPHGVHPCIIVVQLLILLCRHFLVAVVGLRVFFRLLGVAGLADVEVAGPIPIDTLSRHASQGNTTEIAYHRRAGVVMLEVVAQRTLLLAAGGWPTGSADPEPTRLARRCVVVLFAI